VFLFRHSCVRYWRGRYSDDMAHLGTEKSAVIGIPSHFTATCSLSCHHLTCCGLCIPYNWRLAHCAWFDVGGLLQDRDRRLHPKLRYQSSKAPLEPIHDSFRISVGQRRVQAAADVVYIRRWRSGRSIVKIVHREARPLQISQCHLRKTLATELDPSGISVPFARPFSYLSN